MTIETKTMYVADDGSVWTTEDEAIQRNAEIVEQENREIATILNAIQFGSITIKTNIEAFEISKPDEFIKATKLSEITTRVKGCNVIRLEGITTDYKTLAEKHSLNATVLELIDKVISSGMKSGTFYKINNTWYSSSELETEATKVIITIREIDNLYT